MTDAEAFGPIPDKIDLYLVQHGSLTVPVIGVEASRSLCKAFEDTDPYGGIPFSKRLSQSHSEALQTLQEYGIINGLKVLKLEAE